jgi:hypothetical protein
MATPRLNQEAAAPKAMRLVRLIFYKLPPLADCRGYSKTWQRPVWVELMCGPGKRARVKQSRRGSTAGFGPPGRSPKLSAAVKHKGPGMGKFSRRQNHSSRVSFFALDNAHRRD